MSSFFSGNILSTTDCRNNVGSAAAARSSSSSKKQQQQQQQQQHSPQIVRLNLSTARQGDTPPKNSGKKGNKIRY
jgi:hypothetical protein